MKVLVTGATGFIGKKLIADLFQAGHSVVILTRNAETAKKKIKFPCTFFSWDAMQSEPPRQAFEGVEAVINLMGEGIAEKRWSVAQKKKILESRTIGTRNLIAGIEKHVTAPLQVFISGSAIGFYGSRGDDELNEESARGTGFLADVCSSWEDSAQTIKKTCRTVLVRIGIVLGDGGGALSKMLPLFKLGIGGSVGTGKQWMSWIHLNDLVKVFVQALSDNRISGIVNGVSPKLAMNSEFTRVLARVLSKPAFLPAPAFALKIAMGELSSIVLDSQKVQARFLEKIGFEYQFADLEAALTDASQVRVHYKNKKKVICTRFVADQWLDKKPEEVFPFFSDAKVLERVTPPKLRPRVSAQTNTRVEKNARMEIRLRIFGFPVCWVSVIEDCESGRWFTDVQEKGPYYYWYHRHNFIPCAGGTLIHDEMYYCSSRFALLDFLVGGIVRRDLAKAFDYRQGKIAEILAAKQSALGGIDGFFEK